ncbi:efflux RND transporter periplasmic adaptor subunit [Allorhizobium sp. BGMRC 0089]|nr:efflux RND transporter periplasmic adaptor subunit [Allorhizobium sonneratiae]
MTHARKAGFIVLVLILAAAGLYFLHPTWLPVMGRHDTGKGERADAGDRSIAVVAAPVVLADVPVYVTGVGSVKPTNTVVVKAQITGKIVEIGFNEGQDVKKGDLIARLDPALYKAQLDQAIAKKAQDAALLDATNVELARLVKLLDSSAGTQQQVDSQRGLVAQYAAQVEADAAAIEAAQAQLDYTVIKAPIDGRTGIRNVDIGNIVSSGDTDGIVTLSQIRPIDVLFSIPQQNLAEVVKASQAGPLSVEALDQDGHTVIAEGKLTVIDNQVDPTTGTVKLKAEFANQDEALWPGAFVNARLKVKTLKQVMTVPVAAVQRGPGGTYSYIVRPDDTVRIMPVSVTLQDDRIAVITKGLKPGEHVVTTGFNRLQDGAHVRVSTPEEADPAKMKVPLAEQNHGRHSGRKGSNREKKPAAETGSAAGTAEKPAPAAAAEPADASPKPADASQ